jgi:hypothetical protein
MMPMHVTISSTVMAFFLILLPKLSFCAGCPQTKVTVPVTFQFADSDVRENWIYQSLEPRLLVGTSTILPEVKTVANSALELVFCITEPDAQLPSIAKFGPRDFRISARPLSKGPGEERSVPRVYFLNQSRPDWVIVRSISTIRPVGARGDVPSFDVELMNFGKTHIGAQVTLVFQRSDAACAVGQKPASVPVQIALSKQRVSVASGDPEFEDLIRRQVTLKTGVCGGFIMTADLGTTGPLPQGPTRIRYAVQLMEVSHEATLEDGTPAWKEGQAAGIRADLSDLLTRIPFWPIAISLLVSGDRVFGGSHLIR